MYVQDSNEYWPVIIVDPNQTPASVETQWSGWISNGLRGYAGDQKIYQCASRQNGGFLDPHNSNQHVSYCYNYLALDTRSLSATTSCNAGPSKLLVMWDSDNSWNNCGVTSTCGIQTRDLAWYKAGNFTSACWHNNRNNNLFSDGHVAAGHWGEFTWDQILGPADSSHKNVPCLTSY